MLGRTSSGNPDRPTYTSTTLATEANTVDDNLKNPDAIFKMQDQISREKPAGAEQSNGFTNGVTSHAKNHSNNNGAQRT